MKPPQYAQCKYFPLSSKEIGNIKIFSTFVTGDGVGAAMYREKFVLTVRTQAEMEQR